MAAPWPLKSRAWSPSSGSFGTTVLATMFPWNTCKLGNGGGHEEYVVVHLLVILEETQEEILGEGFGDS